MRGIVIAPRYIIEGNGKGIHIPGLVGIEDFDLRRYITYWDKIDFPNNNIIYIESSPDIQFLEETGILKRTMHTEIINGQLDFNVYAKTHLNTFKENEKMEPGVWSLAQSNSELNLLKKDAVKTRMLEVQLYDCLPVPSEEVSIDDILEFKEKRRDELLEFRFLMDNLYEDTLKTGDFERARTHNIQLLQKKVFDIDKLMGESGFSRIKTDLSANINVSDVILDTMTGFGSGVMLGMPDWGALAGFGTSFVKVGLKVSIKPKGLPEDMKDYAYLFNMKKEMG